MPSVVVNKTKSPKGGGPSQSVPSRRLVTRPIPSEYGIAVNEWKKLLERHAETQWKVVRRSRKQSIMFQQSVRYALYSADFGISKLLGIAKSASTRTEQHYVLDLIESIHRTRMHREPRGFDGSKQTDGPHAMSLECTLEDFVRVSDNWELTDERRIVLIKNRINNGGRTPEEEVEFRELQRLVDLRRAYLRYQRTGSADSSFIDEDKLRKLLEKDANEKKRKAKRRR